MKISIITPNFNGGEFIERTLLSVLTQKGEFDLELIIMDGLSTDNSLEEIQKIETMINKGYFDGNCKSIAFSLTSEKDSGQSNAINKGLRLATGDIITYLNSDDTYEPGTLQKVASQLGKSDAKRSYGICKVINEHDLEIRKFTTRYKNIIGKRYSYAKLLSENFISQMTVFWKKEAMDEIGLFNENEHLVMDYEYWCRLGAKYDPIYIPEHLSNFRLYNTSKSGSRFVQQFDDELRVAKKYANGKFKRSIFKHKINKRKIITAYKILGFLGK